VAARRLREPIEFATPPLAEHPYLFLTGRVPGPREVVAHPNSIVIYCVTSNKIEIVAVAHSRQQYPKPA